ncbi:MAG: hypothetical protein HW416_2993, partial [Chloroflexi bacterium]|nr:hypothetical protein [Chloroflexota bacterium]
MQHLRTLASLVFTAVVLFSALLLSPRSAAVAAGSADIVISQLYAGGGRSVLENSLYQNDYVELFNRGASSVDVSTWSLQYQATTQNLSGVIRPGGRLLVAGELATPKPFPLPVAVSGADVSGSLQANPGRGKLALVTSRTLLTCGAGINDCIGNPLIRDFLGYGTVGGGQDGPNNFEALPAIAFKLNQALLRLGEGCTDTDNNRSDFVVSPPRPRNSSTAFHSCPQATATPTASPTATQTPVGGAPRTPVGASTPTLGPSPTSSPLPSPTPVVQRYAIVLDAVPDAGSGPFAVTGGVYGVGSVSASGIASDGAAAVGRYLAFGWRYGSGFGETAGTQVLSLPSGDLSVSGAVPLVIPVTGGTGAFAGARGEVRVSPLGSDGRSFSVQLSVVGSSGSRS